MRPNFSLTFLSESRERAYVYAISSAGAAFAVTRGRQITFIYLFFNFSYLQANLIYFVMV